MLVEETFLKLPWNFFFFFTLPSAPGNSRENKALPPELSTKCVSYTSQKFESLA